MRTIKYPNALIILTVTLGLYVPTGQCRGVGGEKDVKPELPKELIGVWKLTQIGILDKNNIYRPGGINAGFNVYVVLTKNDCTRITVSKARHAVVGMSGGYVKSVQPGRFLYSTEFGLFRNDLSDLGKTFEPAYEINKTNLTMTTKYSDDLLYIKEEFERDSRLGLDGAETWMLLALNNEGSKTFRLLTGTHKTVKVFVNGKYYAVVYNKKSGAISYAEYGEAKFGPDGEISEVSEYSTVDDISRPRVARYKIINFDKFKYRTIFDTRNNLNLVEEIWTVQD